MEAVIVDTDIGDDIDDSYCLAYLLSQQECELVGVTTTRGDTSSRAAIADAMLRATGRGGVPVVAGARTTLGFEDVHDGGCPQARLLNSFAHQPASFFPPDSAVEFITEAVRGRPGEITLLAIGQLTNVALVLASHPDVIAALKQLVVMSGVFVSGPLDADVFNWNARCDSIATWMAYRSPGLRITALGEEISLRHTTPVAEELRRLEDFGGPFQIVRGGLPIWASRYDEVSFHDPLAAASIFAPELYEFQRGRIDVHLVPTSTAPMTAWTPTDNGGHWIATAVDWAGFWQHYVQVTSRWKRP
jgi:purine nucleosidase